ncbi:hypothetical protein B0H13DRAFT_1924776 [Mycena leptocephala]|nr:hypothetical protein B0H13DRAFT_1924776 [Mycena leptocephala]
MADAYTLGHLRMASSSATFQVVSPTSLLVFDRADVGALKSTSDSNNAQGPSTLCPWLPESPCESESDEDSAPDHDNSDTSDDDETHKTSGKKRHRKSVSTSEWCDMEIPGDELLNMLQKIVDNPEDVDIVYNRILKDIFHAFHMIPISTTHRAAFLRTLHDHIMQWDPVARIKVDERTPRYVPPPNDLVPVIQHIYDVFGNALDAETQQPLFSKNAWQKANAVYEKAGVDEHGLDKWTCRLGTNKVEGERHGDIYRKFGALHGSWARLTVNSLTDHRTHYNLQIFSGFCKAYFWRRLAFHHSLGLINRISFLLNYLSGTVDGANSYSDCINGDLYERTNEKFGIAPVPETLRVRLSMEPYTEAGAIQFKLNSSYDWLRCRQGLALPVQPPTTLEARKYFLTKVQAYAAQATANGKGKINYEYFARQLNQSADGKDRYYITTELLFAYAKTMAEEQQHPRITGADCRQANSSLPFPSFIAKDFASSTQPSKGVLDLEILDSIPGSLSIDLPMSGPLPTAKPSLPPASIRHSTLPSSMIMRAIPRRPSVNHQPWKFCFWIIPSHSPTRLTHPPRQALNHSQLFPLSVAMQLCMTVSEGKRRRIVPAEARQRINIRKCRRCKQQSCPGNSEVLNCKIVCTVPYCRGVDKGKRCYFQV